MPSDDIDVRQDVDWAVGQVGYFTTYKSGDLMSAQIGERLRLDRDLDERIAAGDSRRFLAS